MTSLLKKPIFQPEMGSSERKLGNSQGVEELRTELEKGYEEISTKEQEIANNLKQGLLTLFSPLRKQLPNRITINSERRRNQLWGSFEYTVEYDVKKGDLIRRKTQLEEVYEPSCPVIGSGLFDSSVEHTEYGSLPQPVNKGESTLGARSWLEYAETLLTTYQVLSEEVAQGKTVYEIGYYYYEKVQRTLAERFFTRTHIPAEN